MQISFLIFFFIMYQVFSKLQLNTMACCLKKLNEPQTDIKNFGVFFKTLLAMPEFADIVKASSEEMTSQVAG